MRLTFRVSFKKVIGNCLHLFGVIPAAILTSARCAPLTTLTLAVPALVVCRVAGHEVAQGVVLLAARRTARQVSPHARNSCLRIHAGKFEFDEFIQQLEALVAPKLVTARSQEPV
jgi:hypothetical protein